MEKVLKSLVGGNVSVLVGGRLFDGTLKKVDCGDYGEINYIHLTDNLIGKTAIIDMIAVDAIVFDGTGGKE